MTEKKRKPFLKLPVLDLSDRNKRTRWLLRVISLSLAVISWLLVSWDGTSHITKDITVPLRYMDVPEGYSVSDRTNNVNIRIGGSLETLALMGRNDVAASISLLDLRPGRYRLPVQVTSPQSVRVLKVNPQSIEFDLYRMIERTLTPALELDGGLPDGLVLEELLVEPPTVVVKGPEADVVAIRKAVVQTDAETLRKTSRIDLPIVLHGDDEDIAGLTVEPPSVLVSAKLSDAMEEVKVPVAIRVIGVPNGGLDIDRVTVSPDMVTLRGSKSALESFKELALDALDITGQTENVDIDIPLHSPAQGITIQGLESVKVLVEFRSSSETRTFLGVPVKIEGSAADIAWKATPSTVSVIMERSMAETEPFDIEKPPIELYVDVTNIVASQLSLPILYRGLPSGMRVVRIEPSQIYVTASN